MQRDGVIRRRWLGRMAPLGALGWVTVAPLVSACEAPLERSVWKDVSSPEGRFAMKFPGTPKLQKRTKQDEGGSYEVTEYYLERGSSEYLLSYYDLLDEVLGPGQPDQFLDRFQTSLLNADPTRKLVESKSAVAATSGGSQATGFPGRHVEFDDGSTRVVLRLYLVRRRAYLLMTTFPKIVSWAPRNYVDRFLESFTVTG